MSWIETDTVKPGVSAKILEGGDGKRPNWKRNDGWGRMTDQEIQEYKVTRWKRYCHEFVEVPK